MSRMKALINRLVSRYDWLIYRIACRSFARMRKSDAAFLYLLELQLRDWREESGMPPSLLRSAEQFHEVVTRDARKATI